jgi:hypothetical protein
MSRHRLAHLYHQINNRLQSHFEAMGALFHHDPEEEELRCLFEAHVVAILEDHLKGGGDVAQHQAERGAALFHHDREDWELRFNAQVVAIFEGHLKTWYKGNADLWAHAREVISILEAPPPPLAAERLLHYLLPRARREEILGDLQEDYYTTWLHKFGPREARRLYWWHALRSIAPMLWSAVKTSGIVTLIIRTADWLRERLG